MTVLQQGHVGKAERDVQQSVAEPYGVRGIAQHGREAVFRLRPATSPSSEGFEAARGNVVRAVHYAS